MKTKRSIFSQKKVKDLTQDDLNKNSMFWDTASYASLTLFVIAMLSFLFFTNYLEYWQRIVIFAVLTSLRVFIVIRIIKQTSFVRKKFNYRDRKDRFFYVSPRNLLGRRLLLISSLFLLFYKFISSLF